MSDRDITYAFSFELERRDWRMNLMEITKGYDPKQKEQTEQKDG